MKVFITIEADGFVGTLNRQPETLDVDYLATGQIVDGYAEPGWRPGYFSKTYYRNGKFEFEYEKIPISATAALTALIPTLDLTDQVAAKVFSFYPKWEAGQAYKPDVIAQFDDHLYRVIKEHTSQADWFVDKEDSLYALIKYDTDGIEIWVEPNGAHNAYGKGKQLKHEDKLWESLVDGNVWEPGTDENLWKEIVKENE